MSSSVANIPVRFERFLYKCKTILQERTVLVCIARACFMKIDTILS